MSLFERIVNDVESAEGVSRSRFLKKMSRAGAVLFAGVGALVSASPAYATCRTVGCCDLMYCRDCENPNSCANCHSARYSWGCVDQYNHLWECIECYSGSCAGCSLAIYGT